MLIILIWRPKEGNTGNIEKVQVFEKKYDETTQEYLERKAIDTLLSVINQCLTSRYELAYIWTSNTDSKLQLLEQIMVLFNPLNIRTTNNPFDWTALSYVEMTNTTWSSRSVGSTIDDMIDVAFIFRMPILITPLQGKTTKTNLQYH